jgi:hypothetical protein
MVDEEQADSGNDAAGELAVIILTAMFAAPPTIVAVLWSKTAAAIAPEWMASLVKPVVMPMLLIAVFHWFFTAGAIVFSAAIFLRPASPRSRSIAVALAVAALCSSTYLRTLV